MWSALIGLWVNFPFRPRLLLVCSTCALLNFPEIRVTIWDSTPTCDQVSVQASLTHFALHVQQVRKHPRSRSPGHPDCAGSSNHVRSLMICTVRPTASICSQIPARLLTWVPISTSSQNAIPCKAVGTRLPDPMARLIFWESFQARIFSRSLPETDGKTPEQPRIP